MARAAIRVIENRTAKHILTYREVWDTPKGRKPRQGKDEEADVYLERLRGTKSYRLQVGAKYDGTDDVLEHNEKVRDAAGKGTPDPRDVIPLPRVEMPLWAFNKLKDASAKFRRDLVKDGPLQEHAA